MPAGTIALRRVESNRPVMGRDYNLLIDTLLANQGGRVKLWGDDGLEKDRLTGLTASSGNYASDLSSAVGLHQRVRKSDDTLDVWKVEDAGATLVGALGVTGNTTLTGTLSVSGLVAAAAALTVGTTLTVTGLLTGSTANFSGLVAMAAAATVGTTLTVGGAIAANGGVVLPNNVALSATDTTATVRAVVSIDSSNVLSFGQTVVATTRLQGANIQLIGSSGTRIEIDAHKLAFHTKTPIAKPTVTGSRGGNAALANLLFHLDNYGLITDSSSA